MAQTGNKCVVKVANDSAMVGASFKVIAESGAQHSELTIEIISAV